MPPSFTKEEWITEVDETEGNLLPDAPILTVTGNYLFTLFVYIICLYYLFTLFVYIIWLHFCLQTCNLISLFSS